MSETEPPNQTGTRAAVERLRFPSGFRPCRQMSPSGAKVTLSYRELMAHLVQVFWMDATEGACCTSAPRTSRSGPIGEDLLAGKHTLVDSVHADDRDRVVTAVAGQRGGHGIDEEFRIVRPTAMTRWIWARTYPVARRVRCRQAVRGNRGTTSPREHWMHSTTIGCGDPRQFRRRRRGDHARWTIIAWNHAAPTSIWLRGRRGDGEINRCSVRSGPDG